MPYVYHANSQVLAAKFGVLVIACLFFAAAALPVAAQDDEDDPSTNAVELFQKAQDAHEKGQLKEAVALYDKAIAAVAEFPEAEFQRGNALLSLGRTGDAERSFRRAIEIRPDWTLPLASLGSLLVGKGSFAEAEKFLVKAVSLDEQNALAYSALTELRLKTNAKREDLKELLVKLTILTGRAKPMAGAWAARAALESAIGEKAAARASFDKALEIEPKNLFALGSKAASMLDEGDTAGAEVVIRTLEVLSPGSASVQILRARVLVAAGLVDEALVKLNSIAEPSPEVIALRDRIALGKTEDPADLEKQLEKTPNDDFVLGKLCSVYRTANPAKALNYCRRAFEADPQNVNYAIGFGAALVQGRLFAEAVELLRRLQPLSPENVTIRANLATALFQLRRFGEAKTEYEWIAQKQPTSAISYYFLGIVHDQLLEYPDAMANYQLFLRYADAEKNKLEIEKVNLRLPVLQKQIKEKKGKRN